MIAALLRLRIGEWGLRDYGFDQIFGGDKDCEHDFGIIHRRAGDKSGPQTCSKCQSWKGQLGLEPTPEMYIEHLTEIFNEAKRVLKKEGTLWLNIGDTYWSAKGSCFNPGGGEDSIETKRREIYPLNRGNKSDVPNLPQKCLTMIPERLAWSLIQNGWMLRNKIIWYKPNAMPSSVTDRFSNRWEYIFLFSKSQRYYFDLDAVREAYTEPMNRWGGDNLVAKGESTWDKGTGQETYRDRNMRPNPDGKNPGDVFEINTQPFPEAHFAVFPEKLCEKPIKAGCPEDVCKKCGKARERIVEREKAPLEVFTKKNTPPEAYTGSYVNGEMRGQGQKLQDWREAHPPKTIGWTSCKCNVGFEGGIVLDPFCGAGTALLVAKEMKRNYIGIDIKQEYCDMCEKRLAQGVL